MGPEFQPLLGRTSTEMIDYCILAILRVAAIFGCNQSINQSKRIYIAPYVAGESEAASPASRVEESI